MLQGFLKFLLGSSLFLSLTAKAYQTETNTSKSRSEKANCLSLLNYKIYDEKKFTLNGKKNNRYYASLEGPSANAHLARYIFPGLHESDKLIVVIDGVHSYLHYRGYRIDSRGRIEKGKVKSFIQKDPLLSGSMAFVIQNLSRETKSKLEALISQKNPYQALTCTAVTCNILRDVGTGMKKHWFTSGLAYSLMVASARGKPVSIVSLNDKDPIENFVELERLESRLVPQSVHYATLISGAALVYTFSSFLY